MRRIQSVFWWSGGGRVWCSWSECRHGTGEPVVLGLTGGSPIAIPRAAAHMPAILAVWYQGEAGGNAVAVDLEELC